MENNSPSPSGKDETENYHSKDEPLKIFTNSELKRDPQGQKQFVTNDL